MNLIFIALVLPISSSLAAEPLYKIFAGDANMERVCQRNKDVLSCRRIDVDFDLIESMADILIPEVGTVLSFEGLTAETELDKVLSYENDAGFSATLDISKKKVPVKTMARGLKEQPTYLEASLHLGDRIFEIDSCNEKGKGSCHVLLELDPSQFVDEVGVEAIEEVPQVLPGSRRSLAAAAETMDRSTPVLNIKIYYTQALLDSFSNTDAFNAFVNLAISETNTGYSKSGVNLRAELHSTELSTLSDSGDLSALLNSFRDSKDNNCLVRDGADVALLLTLNGNYCGIAYFNVISSGQTFGVVKKNCATGYFSFGHEIAHMAGAHHNQEQVGSITSGTYNYGELIKTTSGQASGARTIMAYYASGYGTRINRYSSATNTYNNNPLGTSTEDNTRQLNEKAASFAAVGTTVTCSVNCKDLGYNGYNCNQYTPDSCNVTWFATNYCPVTCQKC